MIMIRYKKIIQRLMLDDLIDDERISKFEVKFCENKTLRDRTLCKVACYLRLTKQEFSDLKSMIDTAGIIALELRLINNSDEDDLDFLSGFANVYRSGFIKINQLKKLIQFQKKYNRYNFNIPGWCKKLILEIEKRVI